MLETAFFFKTLESHFAKKLPFVVYSKPNNTLVKAILQDIDTVFEVNDFTESGFVFAPFNSSERTVLFPVNHTKTITSIYTDFKTDESFYEEDHTNLGKVKAHHINLVKKGIDAIHSGAFKKVVLSRYETVTLSDSNPIDYFKKLLQTYPTAFVYCWYHPKIGLWLGATPERLLKISGNRFSTVSLAGTQEFKGDINVKWQQKELEEQQYVTDFLVDSLKPIINNIQLSETTTVKAGKLLHLQTKVSGIINTTTLDYKALLYNLHPTPATCGLPKDIAKTFILEHENYNRAYYTGFLGELNLLNKSSRNTNKRNVENSAYASVKKESNLYVNLRCMQLKDQNALIYVGGGITKDSNPELEWQETVNKTKTIKNALI